MSSSESVDGDFINYVNRTSSDVLQRQLNQGISDQRKAFINETLKRRASNQPQISPLDKKEVSKFQEQVSVEEVKRNVALENFKKSKIPISLSPEAMSKAPVLLNLKPTGKISKDYGGRNFNVSSRFASIYNSVYNTLDKYSGGRLTDQKLNNIQENLNKQVQNFNLAYGNKTLTSQGYKEAQAAQNYLQSVQNAIDKARSNEGKPLEDLRKKLSKKGNILDKLNALVPGSYSNIKELALPAKVTAARVAIALTQLPNNVIAIAGKPILLTGAITGIPSTIKNKAVEYVAIAKISPSQAILQVGTDVGAQVFLLKGTGKAFEVVGRASPEISAAISRSLKIDSKVLKGLKETSKFKVSEPRYVRVLKGEGAPKIPAKLKDAIKKEIKANKVSTTIRKAKKLKGTIFSNIRKSKLSRNLSKRAERRYLQQQVRKYRQAKKNRRKELLKSQRKQPSRSRIETESKLIRVTSGIRNKIRKTREEISKRKQRINANREAVKQKKLMQRRVEANRIEKLRRRKALIRQQRFAKSKLGKITYDINKTLNSLGKISKRFENSSELSPATKRLIKARTRSLISKIRNKNVKVSEVRKVENIYKTTLRRLKKSQAQEIRKIQRQSLTPKQIIERVRKTNRAIKQQKNIQKKISRINKRVPGINKATFARLKKSQVRQSFRERPIQQRQVLMPNEEIRQRFFQYVRTLSPEKKAKLQMLYKKVQARRFRLNNEFIKQTKKQLKLPQIRQLALKRLSEQTKRLEGKNMNLTKEINKISQERQRIRRQISSNRFSSAELSRSELKLRKLSQKERQAIKSREVVQRSINLSKLGILGNLAFGVLSKSEQRILQGQPIAQLFGQGSNVAEAVKIVPAIASSIKSAQAQAKKFGIPSRAIAKSVVKTSKPFIKFSTQNKNQIKRLAKPTQLYKVYARIRKKDVLLINRLTELDAKNFMAYSADTNLIRSVVPKRDIKSNLARRLDKKYDGAYTKRSKKFRQFKIRKGSKIPIRGIIEKNKYVLDTPTEKAQLRRLRIKSSVARRQNVKRKLTSSQRRILLKRLKKARKVRMENLRKKRRR